MPRKKGSLIEIPVSPILKDYLDEKLNLEEKKKIADEPGNKLSETDSRQIKQNDKKKVRVLNKKIFQSMANLIYFFEFLNKHPDLIEIYGDDIDDLLGFKPHTNPRYPMLPRLIRAMIGEGYLSDFGDSRFNFRYRLLRIIQFQINQKAMQYYTNPDNPQYEKDVRYKDIVWSDLLRSEIWMRSMDRWTFSQNKPKRIIGF